MNLKKILLLLMILGEAAIIDAETFTRFYIHQKNEPPVSADDRLATKGKYDQEIMFMFYGNTNTMNSHPIIYTRKKYKKLYIKHIDLYHHDRFTSYTADAEFTLPEEVNSKNDNDACWWSDGEYYWLNGYFAKPKSDWHWHCWPTNVLFDRIFEDRLGTTEPFSFKIRIIYHFDDEPEKDVFLNYIVEPYEAKILK